MDQHFSAIADVQQATDAWLRDCFTTTKHTQLLSSLASRREELQKWNNDQRTLAELSYDERQKLVLQCVSALTNDLHYTDPSEVIMVKLEQQLTQLHRGQDNTHRIILNEVTRHILNSWKSYVSRWNLRMVPKLNNDARFMKGNKPAAMLGMMTLASLYTADFLPESITRCADVPDQFLSDISRQLKNVKQSNKRVKVHVSDEFLDQSHSLMQDDKKFAWMKDSNHQHQIGYGIAAKLTRALEFCDARSKSAECITGYRQAESSWHKAQSLLQSIDEISADDQAWIESVRAADDARQATLQRKIKEAFEEWKQFVATEDRQQCLLHIQSSIEALSSQESLSTNIRAYLASYQAHVKSSCLRQLGENMSASKDIVLKLGLRILALANSIDPRSSSVARLKQSLEDWQDVPTESAAEEEEAEEEEEPELDDSELRAMRASLDNLIVAEQFATVMFAMFEACKAQIAPSGGSGFLSSVMQGEAWRKKVVAVTDQCFKEHRVTKTRCEEVTEVQENLKVETQSIVYGDSVAWQTMCRRFRSLSSSVEEAFVFLYTEAMVRAYALTPNSLGIACIPPLELAHVDHHIPLSWVHELLTAHLHMDVTHNATMCEAITEILSRETDGDEKLAGDADVPETKARNSERVNAQRSAASRAEQHAVHWIQDVVTSSEANRRKGNDASIYASMEVRKIEQLLLALQSLKKR